MEKGLLGATLGARARRTLACIRLTRPIHHSEREHGTEHLRATTCPDALAGRLSWSVCTCVYMYMSVYVHVCVCIFTYI